MKKTEILSLKNIVPFSFSLFLSYLSVITFLFNGHKSLVKYEIIYFFISLFLYFFIVKYALNISKTVMGACHARFSKKKLDYVDKIILFSYLPSGVFLGLSSIILTIISFRLSFLAIGDIGSFIEYHNQLKNLNMKFLYPIIFVGLVIPILIKVYVLVKRKKSHFLLALLSSLVSLIAFTFAVTLSLIGIIIFYWFVAIFTSPWKFG